MTDPEHAQQAAKDGNGWRLRGMWRRFADRRTGSEVDQAWSELHTEPGGGIPRAGPRPPQDPSA